MALVRITNESGDIISACLLLSPSSKIDALYDAIHLDKQYIKCKYVHWARARKRARKRKRRDLKSEILHGHGGENSERVPVRASVSRPVFTPPTSESH